MIRAPAIVVGGVRLILSWARCVAPANDTARHLTVANDNGWSPLGGAA